MSELIDRQDVINRLKKAEDVFRQNGAKLEANGIHYALELVESDIEMPTVDAYPFEQLQELVKLNQQFAWKIAELKRPQGEWRHNNFDEHYCNKCGSFALWSEAADGYYEVQSNFCPNCGADMRGEEE